MSQQPVYFDNAATTQVYPETVDALAKTYKEDFWNPSAMYAPAIEADKKLEASRSQIAKALKVPSSKLFFTSGGTEGSNTVIHGVMEKTHVKHPKIITTSIEHPAVLEMIHAYEQKGAEVVLLPVDEFGRADLKALEDALDENTVLVSMMAVNNEVGAINDLVTAGQIIRRKAPKAFFHSDFVQAFMKVDDPRLDIKKADLDAVNICAHKIHGPKGIGALYLKDDHKIAPLILGGGQEKGFRSGTENLALAAGFADAVSRRAEHLTELQDYAQSLKDRLLEELADVEDMKVSSAPDASPYIVSLSFAGIKGEVLLHMLESEGIYVSTGSACSTHHKGGHVQAAIGLDPLYTAGTIRVSSSEFNTPEEVDLLAEQLKTGVTRLRKLTRYKSGSRR